MTQLDLQCGVIGRSGNPVQLTCIELGPGLALQLIAMDNIDSIPVNVFLHHIPGSTAQSQALSLPYGVEPVPPVLPQHRAHVQVNNITGTLSQIKLNKLVVFNLAEKADALTVLAILRGQVMGLRQGTYLGLGVLAQGKQGTA